MTERMASTEWDEAYLTGLLDAIQAVRRSAGISPTLGIRRCIAAIEELTKPGTDQ